MTESAISATDVRLEYRLSRSNIGTIKEYAIKKVKREMKYESLWALDGVSFEVAKGEVFGIIGPNGAGKSTLMRTIATLQAADGGSIEFNGIDVLEQPDRIRRILGYLPQDFGVYPRISAEAMLDHMAILKGIVNAKERKELVAFLLA